MRDSGRRNPQSVVILMMTAWTAFFLTQGSVAAWAKNPAEADGRTYFEERRSWGAYGGLVLNINRTRTDLVHTVLLTATLTWDPSWTVYLPDPGLWPPALAVVREEMEGPNLLDNGSLQTVWRLEIDVLEPGVHTVPEMAWILAERVDPGPEPLESTPRTETLRTAPVPIVVEPRVSEENCPQDHACESALSPPRPLPYSSSRYFGAAFFLFFLCGVLLARQYRGKRTSMRPMEVLPCEKERLRALLESVRGEVIGSDALPDDSLRAVEMAVRACACGDHCARLVETKGTGADDGKDHRRRAEPQNVRGVLEDLQRFCERYRFGGRRNAWPREVPAEGSPGEGAAEVVSAFVDKIDRALETLRRNCCSHASEDDRGGRSDRPVSSNLNRSTGSSR